MHEKYFERERLHVAFLNNVRGGKMWQGEREDLSLANLRCANLSRAILCDADLRGADLSHTYLTGADLRGANLNGAYLVGADLSGADLRRANMEDANLLSADLACANLGSANMRGASLDDACLFNALFIDADLSGASGPFVTFYFGKHHAIAAGGHIQIGCERHTYDEWLRDGDSIGRLHLYTERDILLYMEAIKMAVVVLREPEDGDA